jgi:hypothetical protein
MSRVPKIVGRRPHRDPMPMSQFRMVLATYMRTKTNDSRGICQDAVQREAGKRGFQQLESQRRLLSAFRQEELTRDGSLRHVSQLGDPTLQQPASARLDSA